MKIVVIDPRAELVIRSMPIHDRRSVKQCAQAIKFDEIERGELERVLIAGGTVRIMDRGDPIPVPLAEGAVLR